MDRRTASSGSSGGCASDNDKRDILDLLKLLQEGYGLESAFASRFGTSLDEFEYQWRAHLKKDINWFTYLSVHLYEILFLSAAVLTIFGFFRKIKRRREYSRQEDDEEENKS